MSSNTTAAPLLSPREQEILGHLAGGATYQAIAHRLGLSPHTVDTYARRLRVKTGTANRTQLAVLAVRLGYAVQPSPKEPHPLRPRLNPIDQRETTVGPSTNMRPHPRLGAGPTGGKQQPAAAGEHDAPAATPRTVILDERQRKLISLLIAGHTDSSAAHRLGISARTVTNILRSLMDRLGVDNRFQLGVALGSRLRHTARPAQPRPSGVHMGSVRRSPADQLRDRGHPPVASD